MTEENHDSYDQETWTGDSELARSIWDRHVRAPGVIPMASTLQLARRITGMSIHGLPLLADVQRRWLPANSSFPGTWAALPYASSSRPATEFAPVRTVRPYALLPRPAAESAPIRAVQPLSASPEPGMSAALPVATGVKPAVQRQMASPAETARAMADHRRGAARPLPGDMTPALAGAGDLGVAAVQRYLESLPGQAARTDLATLPSPARSSSDSLPSPVQKSEADVGQVSDPTYRPGAPAVGAGQGAVRVESRATTSARSGEADAGVDIRQRHPGTPVERMLQQRPNRPVAQAESSTLPGVAGAGESVLRYLPLERVIQGQQLTTAAAMRRATDLPLLQTSSSAAAGPGTRLQPKSDEPSAGPQTDRSARISEQVPSGGDIRSSESASTLGRSAASAGFEAHTAASGDLGRVILQRYVDMPLVHPVPSVRVQRDYGMSAAVGVAGSPPSGRPLLPVMESAGFPSGDRLFAPRSEMPLARAVERGGAAGRRGPASPSGAVQRAIELPYDAPPLAGEPHVSRPVSGEGPPVLPVAPQPGLEGIDLERLADAVYGLIERRLIVERESMGY